MSDPSTGTQSEQLEFFFDPVCPFCWQTSRWVEQVRGQRELEIRWRPISLWFLNEGDEDPDSPLGRLHRFGLDLLRVIVAGERHAGAASLGPLYAALSGRIFAGAPPAGEGFDAVCETIVDRGVDVPAALREVGLPESLATPDDVAAIDAALRRNTDEALVRAGDDVGTPVLSFQPPDGPAFFGPVISRLPDDEDAAAVFDAVVTLARFPSFAELKRELREVPQLPLLANV